MESPDTPDAEPVGAEPSDPTPPASTGPGVPLSALLDESADDAALRNRLAEPLRIETEPVENRHEPGQIDTVRTYVYDDLRVRFYDRTGGGPLLERVTVTGGDYRTAEGIGAGSTRAEIEAAYGAPAETHDGDPIYEVPSTPDDPTPLRLQVTYDGDAAERLTWYFYVD